MVGVSIRHQGFISFFQWALLDLASYGLSRALDLRVPAICFVPFLMMQMVNFSRDLVPPAVLLLTTSRWESVRLFTRLARGVWPYRVALLLDPKSCDESRHSKLHWQGFEDANLRLPPHVDWRVAMRSLASFVPFVVLDARVATAAVIEEVRHVAASPDRLRKTYFISDNNGAVPALDAAELLHRRATANTCALEEIVDRLRRDGLRDTASPDDIPGFAERNFARQTTRLGQQMQRAGVISARLSAMISAFEARNGESELTQRINRLARPVNPNVGDGTRQIFDRLQPDIQTLEEILLRWPYWERAHPQHRFLLDQARVLCLELCEMQRMVDAMPPDFMDKSLQTLRNVNI
jgi:hypothetical protein